MVCACVGDVEILCLLLACLSFHNDHKRLWLDIVVLCVDGCVFLFCFVSDGTFSLRCESF